MTPSRTLSRRRFITVTSTAATAAAVGCKSQSPQGGSAMNPTELIELSAVDAVGALRRGDITAERYASALLAQCEREKSLNAFITLEPQRVLEAARAADRSRSSGAKLGSLHGLPIPVKDSANTKEYPTTGGTPALRNFRPAQNAPVVQSLVDAGAIVLGKTNLHELSYGWTSNNLAFGAVHNPYDRTRIPGGSSGGTAAAIASRMAPLGIAEDTEGSIRVPAAMCGIAGFRPTTGRYSTAGAVPISPLFDQLGPHARSVLDLLLFDSVVAADFSPLATTSLKGVKVGIVRKYWYVDLDPEVEQIAGESLHKLQDAGVELVESEIPELAGLIALTTQQIQSHDVLSGLKKYLADFHTGVTFDQLLAQASPEIKRDFATSVLPGGKDFVSDAVYRTACDIHLPKLRKLLRDYFARAGVAALVFPTTMVAALPIGQDVDVQVGAKKISFDTAVSRNIDPGSTAGLPGLVLPAGLTSAGLPVAMEFDAPAGADRTLLSLGSAIERIFGHLPAPKY
jgi:Asp-tRNA(Asn)/Glu-tRNA(Gln) amidotransferase A subunit family amidase